MGRHSVYTPELADKVAELLEDNKTYTEIGAIIGVERRTILNWQKAHEDFFAKCVQAKIVQAEAIAEKIASVCKDLEDKLIEPDAARVLLNTLQWLAKVRNPRVYGDKTTLSNDPDNPIGSLALRLDTAINHKIIDITPETKQISHLPGYDDISDLL